MSNQSRRCETCRHWSPLSSSPDDDVAVVKGECHRYPPVPNGPSPRGEYLLSAWSFPVVGVVDVCGEWGSQCVS